MYGRISDAGMIVPWWHWLFEPQVEISALSGAVSTRGTTVFVPGLLGLQMYAKIYDAGTGLYPPRVALALRISGWSFHTVRSGIATRGTIVFVPGLLQL